MVFRKLDRRARGFISLIDLVKHMNITTRRLNFVHKTFGISGSNRAVEIFRGLDQGGDGRVDLELFIDRAGGSDSAFSRLHTAIRDRYEMFAFFT